MIRTPGGVVLCAHAVRQMLDRDVTPVEIDRVLADPEQTYCRPSRRTVHQRGDILVVSEADGVVVTVLFHLPEGWPDGQRRPSGRRMSKLARRRLTADLRRAGGH